MAQYEENARFMVGCGCSMLAGALLWCLIIWASYHIGAWVLG